ncbi:hypothetical protein HYZ99_05230 [Candidatus Peregrinibacteria bacterium]|nr:hypothetical protein [Candidatus Peregrinibacteria bacterium]
MINPHKTGLALGGTIAAWHLLWSLLVLAGWAQFVIDRVFRLHFITPPYTVGQFSLVLAVGLIVVTFVTGYVVGWAFSVIWNRMSE